MSKRLYNSIKSLIRGLGVLGVSSLIAFPAYSQTAPINSNNTSLSDTTSNRPLIRVTPGIPNLEGTATYPSGSSINRSGRISTPRGQSLYPNVRIRNGDGSTTYYYQNGTRIRVDETKLPPTGSPLRWVSCTRRSHWEANLNHSLRWSQGRSWSMSLARKWDIMMTAYDTTGKPHPRLND